MVDKSSMLFISIVGIMTALALSDSNIHAATVNNSDFSIEVPNGWVYREDFLIDNGTLLTPNEFADVLASDNASAIFDVLHGGVLVELVPDTSYPLKNAPVEVYAKHASKLVNNLFPTYENASMGGERAIKVFLNSTDIASKLGKANFPISLVMETYFVMHDDQPYSLTYRANATDYQKYLPQFEQMLKTFKFTK